MNLNEISIPNPQALPPPVISADNQNQSSIDSAVSFSTMYPWSLKVLLINFAPFEKVPNNNNNNNSANLIIPFLKIFSTFPLLERVIIYESKINNIKFIKETCTLNLKVTNDQDLIDIFHSFSEDNLKIQHQFELDMTLHGMTTANTNDPIETGVK